MIDGSYRVAHGPDNLFAVEVFTGDAWRPVTPEVVFGVGECGSRDNGRWLGARHCAEHAVEKLNLAAGIDPAPWQYKLDPEYESIPVQP